MQTEEDKQGKFFTFANTKLETTTIMGFTKYILLIFNTLICFSASNTLWGQIRPNEPLIYTKTDAFNTFLMPIKGWMFSVDGQWMSGEQVIPVRLNSRETEALKKKENKWGSDNLMQMKIYPLKYGKEKYYVLIKFYTQGYYKYAETKKGWKENLIAYYYIINEQGLKTITTAPNNEELFYKIDLFDSGLLHDTSPKNAIEEVLKNARIKPNYDRTFNIHLYKKKNEEKVYFFFYAQHKIFIDTEGVLNDSFKVRGKTIYGQKQLLQYMYYETSHDDLMSFFSNYAPEVSVDFETESNEFE